MKDTTIPYTLVSSGHKDYVKIMLGDTEIIYVKTNKQNFNFIRQELSHMLDAINVVPVLVSSMKKLRGIEAWIPPRERNLIRPLYDGLEEFEKTSLGKYMNN